MSTRPSLRTFLDSRPLWLKSTVVFLLFLTLIYVLTDTNCMFEAVLGIPCPGCGLTRATLAFLQLDFAKAFQFHPLFLLAYADIALISYTMITGKQSKAAQIFLIVSMVLFLGVYVYRMLTLYPDVAPMKPNPNSLLNRLMRWINP